MKWTHFYVTESLPGKSYGTGGIGLADFDGDGDLDILVSRRETKSAYWFDRKDDAKWIQHVVGTSDYLEETLGAAALDVDHDGHVDIVFSNFWFRNPGNLSRQPDTLWEFRELPMGGQLVHDIIAADVNGDGFDDIVTYNGDTLSWFDTSNRLARTIIATGLPAAEGIAPHGVGDICGNGRLDIVVPGAWFENPGNGNGTWKQHSWPHVPIAKSSYGIGMRVWVADINGDGKNDIVYSDCDTAYSHVYWVENLGRGERWVRHRLPDPPGNSLTGSFHSLAVADFNHDGRLEVFAAEQEDPDTFMVKDGLNPMKPEGLKERGVIWVNTGSRDVEFQPTVLSEGRPGWHDAVIGDVNGDGSIDIVSKVWNADGPNYHVDYWRNDSQRT